MHAAQSGSEPKNFRIRRAVHYDSGRALKIDRGFPEPQSATNLGIQVGVRLKTKAQTPLVDLSLRDRIEAGPGSRNVVPLLRV